MFTTMLPCNRTNLHCCQCFSFMILHFEFCTQFCFGVNLTIRYLECRGFDFSNCCYMWMDINVKGQDIMNELGWQTLEQRTKYYVSSLIFKSIHGLNPHWINNNILMACENHNRNTRFANNMNVVVSKPNVETFRNSFMYQGAISWNSLPPHLKYATIHDSFKRLYKKEYFYAPT